MENLPQEQRKQRLIQSKPSEKGEIITYLSRMGDVLKPGLDACKIVVCAVGINGVEIVVDGNIADTILRKGEGGVKPCQRGISAKSG